MYIDITGLDKRDLVLCLSSYALRYLGQIDPEQRAEYELQRSALEVYEGQFPLVGFLPFLPRGMSPWIDLRGDQFDTVPFDAIFGENAAAGVIDIARETREKRQAEAEGSGASISTATGEHGIPGSGLPPHRRYRLECAMRASGGAESSAGGAFEHPLYTDPTSMRGQLLASLDRAMAHAGDLPEVQAAIDCCMAMAMQAPTTSTSAEAGSSTGTPPDKRYRVEYALRASEPGPSTSGETGSSAGTPPDKRYRVEYALRASEPGPSTSGEAGSSTGTPPDKRYRVEYALRASEPGPSTSGETGSSAGESPYTRYGQPSAFFDSAMDNTGGPGGAQAGIDCSMAMATQGPGTSGEAGSSGDDDEQPSTSLEKAGCSHGPHTGHHRH